jgi:superfamily II DNA/RNA helicase
MGMASIQTRGIYCVSVFIPLSSSMYSHFAAGKVLIFVTRKDNCAELAKNLRENGFTGKYF